MFLFKCRTPKDLDTNLYKFCTTKCSYKSRPSHENAEKNNECEKTFQTSSLHDFGQILTHLIWWLWLNPLITTSSTSLQGGLSSQYNWSEMFMSSQHHFANNCPLLNFAPYTQHIHFAGAFVLLLVD